MALVCALLLITYEFMVKLQLENFGRAYAAYGKIFIIITRCATKNDKIRVLGDHLTRLISESFVNQGKKNNCTQRIIFIIWDEK